MSYRKICLECNNWFDTNNKLYNVCPSCYADTPENIKEADNALEEISKRL